MSNPTQPGKLRVVIEAESHEIYEGHQCVATLWHFDIGEKAAARYATTFVAAANKNLRRREAAREKKGEEA